MTKSLTGYRLRKDAAKAVQTELEEQGLSKLVGAITVAQLNKYVDHGLVEPAVDGRWAPHAVEQLYRAHALGEEALHPHARSLNRRVLLRFTENTRAISVHTLREALLAVLPTIPEAARKMKRISALIEHWHAQEARANDNQHQSAKRSRRQTPPRRDWAQLVSGAPDDILFNVAESQVIFYGHMLSYLEEQVGGPQPNAPGISDIPPDERLALLTVRALWRRNESPTRPAFEGSRNG